MKIYHDAFTIASFINRSQPVIMYTHYCAHSLIHVHCYDIHGALHAIYL